MLNEFLKVAYAKSVEKQEQSEFVTLMKQLPLEELYKIANGEKVAYLGPCSPDGGSQSWVEQFKGTPFMEQAIGLEQELLQAEMANQQRSQVENQRSQQGYAAMDQIRLKKRLLEIQKAKGEMGTLASAGMAVSGSLPGEQGPDQGEGAPAGIDMAGMPAKTAASFHHKYPHLSTMGKHMAVIGGVGAASHALRPVHHKKGEPAPSTKTQIKTRAGRAALGAAGGALMGTIPTALASRPGALSHEAGHLAKEVKRSVVGAANRMRARATMAKMDIKEKVTKPSESTTKAVDDLLAKYTPKPKDKKASVADAVGRLMAQADMEKAAHQQAILATGDRAGRLMAKSASMGDAVLRVVKANPVAAGTAALGAFHGLTKEDGGVGSALVEGAGGAVLGHAAQGIGGRMQRGKTFGDALKGYGNQVSHEGKILSKGVNGQPVASDAALERWKRIQVSKATPPAVPGA